jgi:hypothetical protein
MSENCADLEGDGVSLEIEGRSTPKHASAFSWRQIPVEKYVA